MREKLRFPPSTLTGELWAWAMDVWRVVNNMPTVSYFSGTTPNSVITGLPGDLAVNVGSASTDSRVWMMGGSAATPSLTGWKVVRIA